jgi:hypothetical protein
VVKEEEDEKERELETLEVREFNTELAGGTFETEEANGRNGVFTC